MSACVAEQERSEILSRLEACLNSQAGSPDLRQRGDYLRHLSYLRNEQFLRVRILDGKSCHESLNRMSKGNTFYGRKAHITSYVD